jgi:hypothetical protein
MGCTAVERAVRRWIAGSGGVRGGGCTGRNGAIRGLVAVTLRSAWLKVTVLGRLLDPIVRLIQPRYLPDRRSTDRGHSVFERFLGVLGYHIIMCI